jgi:signal transduction histidine kinase
MRYDSESASRHYVNKQKHLFSRRFLMLSLLLIFPLAGTLYAATPVVLEEGKDVYPLGLYLEYLEDKNKKFSIENIGSSSSFVTSERESPNFGFTSSVLWVRFTIKVPEGNKTQWYLEVGYPLLDNIKLYIPERNGTYTVKEGGDSMPFDHREVEYQKFVFSLKNEPGLYTYYLNVETTSSLSIPLAVLSEEKLLSEMNRHQMLYGIFYGSLIIMILFNLLLAIYTRDYTYYYYVLYIISFIMVSLSMSGTGFQYLWRSIPQLNDMVPSTLFFCFFWIMIFTRSFLQTKVVPVFDSFLIITILISAVGFCLSPFISYPLGIRIGAAYAIFLVPLSVMAGVISLWKGIRQARFYLIAFGFFLAGVLLSALNRFGILPSTIFTVWSFQIGSLMQIVLLSFALGDRINILKREKEKAQSEALRYQEWLIESLKRTDQLKDEFLNNLSHELKTPLAVIYAYAELLRDGDERDIEKFKSYGDRIYDNIDKLKHYIEDLVLLTDIEAHPSLVIKEINIRDIITRSLEKFSTLISEHRIEINTDVRVDQNIQADDKYIQRAVDSIIKNAILFNRRGGSISISTDVQKTGDEIGGTITLSIEDTGIGIPDDRIYQIWDKFYRIDNSLTYEVSGVGVGLFLAKRIIELHGGTISVESKLNRGSRFTIELPLER